MSADFPLHFGTVVGADRHSTGVQLVNGDVVQCQPLSVVELGERVVVRFVPPHAVVIVDRVLS